MECLLEEIYGKDFKEDGKVTTQSKGIMAQLFGNELDIVNVEVNMKTFLQFANKHQSLLFQAFKFQTALIEGIVGRRFWKKQSDKRYKYNSVNMNEYKTLYDEIFRGQKRLAVDEDGEIDYTKTNGPVSSNSTKSKGGSSLKPVKSSSKRGHQIVPTCNPPLSNSSNQNWHVSSKRHELLLAGDSEKAAPNSARKDNGATSSGTYSSAAMQEID
jgi:hypothetical protein